MTSVVRFLLTLAALALAGCVPADPLDWKISAKTPAQFNEWRDEDLPRLPAEVQKEFIHTFNFFAAQTPGVTSKRMDATDNPLCRRLHGRTIRNVIIEGYSLETTALLSKISTTSDNLLRNLQRSQTAAAAPAQDRFDRVQLSQTDAIAVMEKRLAEIKARVAVLSRSAR